MAVPTRGSKWPLAVRRQAKDLWCTGHFATMLDLERELGVPKKTLDDWRRDDGWDLAQAAYTAKLERERAARLEKLQVYDFKHYRAFDKILEIAEKMSGALEVTIDGALRNIEGVEQLTPKQVKQVVSAIQAGKLRDLATVIGNVQAGQRKALGIDKDANDGKVELEIAISGATPREIDVDPGSVIDVIRTQIDTGALPGDPRADGETLDAAGSVPGNANGARVPDDPSGAPRLSEYEDDEEDYDPEDE